jgi:peptidyl-Lys metalloendopeptidase
MKATILLLLSVLLFGSTFGEISIYLDSTLSPLEVRFGNPTAKDIRFLRWNTPWDALAAYSSFIIKGMDGKEVPYEGAIVKYGVPSDKDFILLPRQSFLSTSVSLDKSFYLIPGQYNVQLILRLKYKENDTILVEKILQSNVVPLVVNSETGRRENTTVAVKYDGCSNTQTTQIQVAFGGSKTIVNDALSAVNGGGGPQFPIWFGTSKTDKVKQVLTLVKSAFDGDKLNYKCNDPNCDPGVFAFVYPNDKNYVVYLCGAFWSASSCSPYDAKCGTIVHETSHFNTFGATKDIQYGTSGCKQLAKTNPASAVQNADSYEYFCESQLL